MSFIQFDICEFYPSISEDLLNNALVFAETKTNISEDDKNTFLHCRKSYLCHNSSVWVKKSTSNFDVTMGSYDGAEVCDLVGLYILSQLQNLNLRWHR